MTDSMGSATSLSVHQKATLHENEGEDAPIEASETLTYQFSRACRLESVSPPSTRIHLVTMSASVMVQNGSLIDDPGHRDGYLSLLLFRSRKILQERLLLDGVDLLVSSLGKFEETPVYILGAQYPDISKPQVWLDKETFRPLRYLIPEGEGDGEKSLLEFRYLEWQKQNGLWYPVRIQCFRNDRLIEEISVIGLSMNPFVMDDVFNVERLKALYGAGAQKTQAPISTPE
jgi:hypothetical protein